MPGADIASAIPSAPEHVKDEAPDFDERNGSREEAPRKQAPQDQNPQDETWPAQHGGAAPGMGWRLKATDAARWLDEPEPGGLRTRGHVP